jgi:hypothetical protein
MHEFWTILIANVTYTRLQNYTILVVGEHGIQPFKVVVVVLLLLLLSFNVFAPHEYTFFIILHKWFV